MRLVYGINEIDLLCFNFQQILILKFRPRTPTAKPKTPKTPSVPKTPATSNGKAPKTAKPKTPSSKPKTPKRPKSRSPAKTSFFSLSSLTGFALGAPLNNQAKRRDKSPTPVKNGQPKSQQRVRTSGSVKRR